MTDVFISYKREERARCVAIYNALVDLKLSVWFDAHIEPGTSFDREIEREVRTARAILVLWSELACDSDWIRAEARTGKQGERLVAVRLDDCLPPLEFASVQAVDLFDAGNFQSGEGWRQTAGRIGRLAKRPGLGDYVRAEQLADPALWRNWIEANPTEPLLAKAKERLAALTEQLPLPTPASPPADHVGEAAAEPDGQSGPSVLEDPDRSGPGQSTVFEDLDLPDRRPNGRTLYIVGAVTLLIAALLVWTFTGGGDDPAPLEPTTGETRSAIPADPKAATGAPATGASAPAVTPEARASSKAATGAPRCRMRCTAAPVETVSETVERPFEKSASNLSYADGSASVNEVARARAIGLCGSARYASHLVRNHECSSGTCFFDVTARCVATERVSRQRQPLDICREVCGE